MRNIGFIVMAASLSIMDWFVVRGGKAGCVVVTEPKLAPT